MSLNKIASMINHVVLIYTLQGLKYSLAPYTTHLPNFLVFSVLFSFHGGMSFNLTFLHPTFILSTQSNNTRKINNCDNWVVETFRDEISTDCKK